LLAHPEPIQVVDEAKVDTRAANPKFRQRLEEFVPGGTEGRNIHEIHAPPRRCHSRVDQYYRPVRSFGCRVGQPFSVPKYV
jgi:hypothetical protein